jgi:hypothetical protein
MDETETQTKVLEQPTQKLPMGMQGFTDVRKWGCVYVDKTARIHDLITSGGKVFFLSRPRRFGKSLLCSTLQAIFEAGEENRKLFEEIAGKPALAINERSWGWERHPVIRIDLNAGSFRKFGVDALHRRLRKQIRSHMEKFGLKADPDDGDDVVDQFETLIERSSKKFNQGAVVIIDEYDKPLINTLHKPDIHADLRDALSDFYGVLKTRDDDLRFVFITGVSKFAHVSIFSDLNQPCDITLDPEFADICGFTEEEVEANFAPEIEVAAKFNKKTRADYLDRLREFYNGYRFSRSIVPVYNPFGLVNHFKMGGEFSGYWYRTATPSFLVKLIQDQRINIQKLGEKQITATDRDKFDVRHMQAVPLLWQTGYLSIKDYDVESTKYSLGYPNGEVASSFSRSLLGHYLGVDEANTLDSQLSDAFQTGELTSALETLESFLESIPYDIIDNTEKYYHTAVHLIFSMLGLHCHSEVRTASGRLDATVEINQFIYLFEFKVDQTAQFALDQIERKRYDLALKRNEKQIFKIGVNFNSVIRNIDGWIAVCGDEEVGKKQLSSEDIVRRVERAGRAAAARAAAVVVDQAAQVGQAVRVVRSDKRGFRGVSPEKAGQTAAHSRKTRHDLSSCDDQSSQIAPTGQRKMGSGSGKAKNFAVQRQKGHIKATSRTVQSTQHSPCPDQRETLSQKSGNRAQSAASQVMSGEREGTRDEVGLEKVVRNMLLRLLELQFGPLPDLARSMVSKASLRQLEDWSLNASDAAELAEVFV